MSPLKKHLVLIAAIAVVLAACSTEKDAFLNRTFHRLNARDNGYFNANEKLKETVTAMKKAYPEDYDAVLPIFVYGTEVQAKANVPEFDKCIEKCAVVIDRHSMDIKDKERNTWIDDSYFVIGKSHFYKRSYYDAQRTFDFVARRFKGQDRQLESKMWLARTAIQLEQYAKAQSLLDEIRNEKVLPKKFPHDELSALQADLDLKRGKVDNAITNLENAVSIAEDHQNKVRWAFILAQLYQAKGYDEKATAQYARVERMRPTYEIGFRAKIFQALALEQGNTKAIRQKLKRMLKDDKNIDHFDMIHYAIADLDLKEGMDSSAIAHLKTSSTLSTTDINQKAKTFLKLADVYFDARDYPDAQLYYDSTITVLNTEHKRYDEVKTRAEVLGELVEQLDIIATEDSLQKLGTMDAKDREKIVRDLIKKREAEEEEKARQEAEARETNSTPATPNKPTPAGGGGSNAWWAYNPQALARGAAEFKKKWGARTLEDNWRRKDKGGSATEIEEGPDVDGGDVASGKEEGEPEWKDPNYYLRNVPNDSVGMDESNVKVCEALYKCGIIYKEKLHDVDNAVESFEILNNRFEECRYTPESYYQLFRIYLEKERKGYFSPDGFGSQTYANIILERWPDSEFARLVRDPDALEGDVARRLVQEAEYEQVYREYHQGLYSNVIASCNQVITNEPRNMLLPKYALLKAMAYGGLRDKAALRTALNEVINTHAGTEEAKAAADLLAVLDNQSAPPSPKLDKPVATYGKSDGEHLFVMVFPNADGDVGGVKTAISNFNAEFVRGAVFSVTSSFLDADNQVVLVNKFESKTKVMEYYELFKANEGVLIGINDQGYATFAITAANYALVYKSKDLDGYMTFFTENYLEGE